MNLSITKVPLAEDNKMTLRTSIKASSHLKTLAYRKTAIDYTKNMF